MEKWSNLAELSSIYSARRIFVYFADIAQFVISTLSYIIQVTGGIYYK